jgi:hypothetical protein
MNFRDFQYRHVVIQSVCWPDIHLKTYISTRMGSFVVLQTGDEGRRKGCTESIIDIPKFHDIEHQVRAQLGNARKSYNDRAVVPGTIRANLMEFEIY